ncbi:HXXEE domain-containing protein [bacterium]|nr:HXXEE domain-containing protein [bacterium]
MRLMMQGLIMYWVYGTFPAAILLLGLFPALDSAWSFPLGLVYLQIPFYMLHQVEEHVSGRFAVFLNQTVGHGKEIITPAEIFWVNVPGVWGINLASFLLASFFHVGLGLIAVYLSMVNALTHLLACFRWRQYNPGLFTSVFLFFPIGILSLFSMGRHSEVTPAFHWLGISIAFLIHVGLVFYFTNKLRKAPSQTARH